MKAWIHCLVSGWMLTVTGFVLAGNLAGTVQAKAKAAAPGESGGKYDSRKFKFAERVDYESLRDFVVYLEGAVETNAAASLPPVRVTTRNLVSQKGATFSPHILPVVAGTVVEWPNEDEIFHNVFSISEAKEFDLGLYKKPEVKQVTFDRTGRVDVFCSIHSTMNCVVLVVPNRYYAVTDSQGHYLIKDIPAGTYQVRAWHERLPGRRQSVTIPAAGDLRLDFILGPGGSPQP